MGNLQVWHLTPDAHRRPRRVSAGERVLLEIGTWPIALGQRVWITWWSSGDAVSLERCTDATWTRNEGENSYWSLSIGPFRQGDIVEYAVCASNELSEVMGPRQQFRVGPKIHLALMWHQHQPMYRLEGLPGVPALVQPWVRLHALRDYYSMAALVAEHPDLHVTFNITPVLLAQLDDYIERSVSDRALTLTLTPPDQLTKETREELLGSFFDADWHQQIFVHARYRALFEQRVRGDAFSTQDLRDLQMWFNLAWFGKEFRDAPVKLATGETVAVHRFVERGTGFSTADVCEMVDDQYKIMRAVIPIHRTLQDRAQIEVTTTPFYHPILPLVMDTDQATVDLDGATLPGRFAYPEDADAQVQRAALDYVSRFGRPPLGMWPAEGAVSDSSIPLYAANGIRWIATDRGVLARSGRWGFDVEDVDVLCQPYLVNKADTKLTIFFRDTSLSDAIGFRYAHLPDADAAAAQFLREIEERFANRLTHDEDRLVTVILDGENAWGAYVDDGRPFLRALYARLANMPSIQTVTFSEYLSGNLRRRVLPHVPTSTVEPLFAGSWIDEMRSRPGVDLGTWIGEPEENRAWELLGDARRKIDSAQPALRAQALESAYAAEGSDWFWWFGSDQDSGNDPEFDALFRAHVRAVYAALRLEPPADLSIPLVVRSVVWTFAQPLASVPPGDRLIIRTNCPGTLVWRVDDGPEQTADLQPVGGVLAGARRFEIPLGAIAAAPGAIRFRFLCGHGRCTCHDACCRAELQTVTVRAGVDP